MAATLCRDRRSGFAVVGDGGEGFGDGGELRKDGGVEVGGELVSLFVGGAGEVGTVLVKALAMHEGLDFLVGFGDAGDVEVAEFDEDGGHVAHGCWMRGARRKAERFSGRSGSYRSLTAGVRTAAPRRCGRSVLVTSRKTIQLKCNPASFPARSTGTGPCCLSLYVTDELSATLPETHDVL